MGENSIKFYRVMYGYSLRKTGEILGVSRTAVMHWERGDYLPRAERLMTLAKTFNCTAEQLLSPPPKIVPKRKRVRKA